MLRVSLALVLAFQMVMPPRAVAQLLPAPSPSQSLEQVCPCSGKKGCHCCGCTPDSEGEQPSSKQQSNGLPELRCPGSAPDAMDLGAVVVPIEPSNGWLPCPPRPSGWMMIAEVAAFDTFHSIDPRPPRLLA
jgi:hypothetical protein